MCWCFIPYFSNFLVSGLWPTASKAFEKSIKTSNVNYISSKEIQLDSCNIACSVIECEDWKPIGFDIKNFFQLKSPNLLMWKNNSAGWYRGTFKLGRSCSLADHFDTICWGQSQITDNYSHILFGKLLRWNN